MSSQKFNMLDMEIIRLKNEIETYKAEVSSFNLQWYGIIFDDRLLYILLDCSPQHKGS